MVFSLIPWSGRIRAEFHVHRVTWDTPRLLRIFAHPAVTVSGRPFQAVTLILHMPCQGPSTPRQQVAEVWAVPLSLATTCGITLFSFPGVTEMFHFAPCRSDGLWIHPAVIPYYRNRVSPFGDPRIIACLRLPVDYRSLLRPSSPSSAKAFTLCP